MKVSARNKILAIVMAASFTFVLEGVAVASALPVIEVRTCQDLRNIDNGQVVLLNDIDCAGISNFQPIGPQAAFKGSFDGKGFSIRNLNVTVDANVKEAGLFSRLDGASVRNLHLKNIIIDGPGASSGALAGRVKGSSLSRIIVENADVAGKNAGALAGEMDFSEIGQVSVSGRVRGYGAVGGCVGHAIDTSISDSYSLANVSFLDKHMAGINGEAAYLGGFIGVLDSRSMSTRIIRTFAIGPVDAGKSNAVTGGWVAMQKKFGLLRSDVMASYFDRDVMGQGMDVVSPATGLNTQMMYRPASFTGFDFDNTWVANRQAGYPRLQYEGRPRVSFLSRKVVSTRGVFVNQEAGKVIARNEKAGLVLAIVKGAGDALVPALFVRNNGSFEMLTKLIPPDYRIAPHTAQKFQYKGAITDDGTVSLMVMLTNKGNTKDFPAVYKFLVEKKWFSPAKK